MQYNPHAAVWGNISWYHLKSRDLVHWIPVGIALQPSEWYDALGCFSGSISRVNNSLHLLYTGQASDGERQVLATPADDSLELWNKVGVVIDAPPSGKLDFAFRDPSDIVDGTFVVGANHSVLLYNATDYSFIDVLFSLADENVMECPEVVPIDDDTDLLKYSSDKVGWCTI